MVENFISNSEKLEFRQIVLQHLKDILRLGQVEFRGGYMKEISHGAYSTHEYVPDSRDCYINAVLGFIDILLPYFDDRMNKVYGEYYDIIQYPGTQKFRNNQLFIDWLKGVTNKNLDKEDVEIASQFVSEFKVYYARKLFREANLLLHRIDYLKEAVFAEGDDEEDNQ